MSHSVSKKINHSGFEYEIDKICQVLDTGVDEKTAIRTLYPSLPTKSIAPVLAKVRKNPYFIARKDLKLNLLAEKGPELQMKLLDIALHGRSERNQLEATNSALDRVYGNAKDDEANKPQFTFNFSFTGADTSKGHLKVESKVIDVD